MDFSRVPLHAAPLPVAAPGIRSDRTGVTVTWQPPAEPGTEELTGYVVTLTPERGKSAGKGNGHGPKPLVTTAAADARSVTFTSVPAGRWSATVVAVSGAGSSAASDPSATVVVTKSRG